MSTEYFVLGIVDFETAIVRPDNGPGVLNLDALNRRMKNLRCGLLDARLALESIYSSLVKLLE